MITSLFIVGGRQSEVLFMDKEQFFIIEVSLLLVQQWAIVCSRLIIFWFLILNSLFVRFASINYFFPSSFIICRFISHNPYHHHHHLRVKFIRMLFTRFWLFLCSCAMKPYCAIRPLVYHVDIGGSSLFCCCFLIIWWDAQTGSLVDRRRKDNRWWTAHFFHTHTSAGLWYQYFDYFWCYGLSKYVSTLVCVCVCVCRRAVGVWSSCRLIVSSIFC